MKATLKNRDKQLHKGWVAIELTTEGELRASDGTLDRLIRRDLGVPSTFPIFIPIRKSTLAKRSVVVSAMEGYVFVGAGLPPGRYLLLEKRSYAEQVLCSASGSSRSPHVLPDAALIPLRGQINRIDRPPDIKRGTQVEVLSGMLASMRGDVLEVDKDVAVIRFSKRTLVRILSLPVSILRVVEEAKASPAEEGTPPSSLVPAELSTPTPPDLPSPAPTRSEKPRKTSCAPQGAAGHLPQARAAPPPPREPTQLGFAW